MTFHELNQAVVKALLESSLNDPSLSKQDLSKNLRKVRLLMQIFRLSSSRASISSLRKIDIPKEQII